MGHIYECTLYVLGGLEVKDSDCNAGHLGSVSGLGKSSGEGKG